MYPVTEHKAAPIIPITEWNFGIRIEAKRINVERIVLKTIKKELDSVLIKLSLLSMKSVAETAIGSMMRANFVVGTIIMIQEIKVPKICVLLFKVEYIF